MKYLLILLPLFSFGQSLDQYGQYFKDNYPSSYEVIKSHASEKWGNDFSMVLYEINKQCKACYDFFELTAQDNADINIAYEAINKWAYDGYEIENSKLIEQERTSELHVDWAMVLYEYEKQMKAKGAF